MCMCVCAFYVFQFLLRGVAFIQINFSSQQFTLSKLKFSHLNWHIFIIFYVRAYHVYDSNNIITYMEYRIRRRREKKKYQILRPWT